MFRQALSIAPLIALAAPVSAATVQIDFNSDQSPPIQTQAGWLGTDAAGNGTLGGITVATTAVGGGSIASRDRDAANGGGAEANMWQDFLFSNDGTTGTTKGLQITISGLADNTEYPVIVWGYDNSSTSNTPRVADWSAAGGGSGTLSFNPATGTPTDLTTHSFTTFNATSNGSGQIILTGLPASSGSSASHDVFINGLEIGDPVPEPATLALMALGGLCMARRRRA